MFETVVRTRDNDIGIVNGKIAALGRELPAGRHEIDATALIVLPGLIDVHVHFNDPGRDHWEGARTGSRALAKGGGVAFFDMPLNSSPCTTGAAEFEQKRRILASDSLTDFGLWGGIIPGNRDSLAALAELGAIGFKAFLSNSGLPEFPRADDLTLFEGMCEAARADLPVAVHAESEEITAALTARLIAAGRKDIGAFLESRPVLAEVEAVHRAALLAREAGCKLHVVHISSGKGIAAALEARRLGTDLTIETCPHYLFFTDEDLHRIGSLAKCAPPLRSANEQAALRRHLFDGNIDIVASDHSPCPLDLKLSDNLLEVWGGIGGVQSTLAVLLELGVAPAAIAQLTSANPAERFGLGSKGRIAIGCDADLVLVESGPPLPLHATDLAQRHAVSPYVGRKFRYRIRRTIRRGETIFQDGQFPDASLGRILKRNAHAKPRTDP